MDSAERIAQLSFIIGISDIVLKDEEKRILETINPLGVILFKRNYSHPEQLRSLVKEIKECCGRDNVIICVDQEGGRVQRFTEPFTILPSAKVLGSTENEYLALEIGRIIATELLACGVNMNLAPVCDINTNPENKVIADRAYGSSADLVMRMSESFMKGLWEGGVLTCAKHFPGHGDTSVDSHEALPVCEKNIEELYGCELLPFINVIEKGVDSIMMAHILFPSIDRDLPASMSKRFVSLLRNELAFDGIIMTDDMEMKAISRLYSVPDACSIAISNGIDVVLICHTLQYQREAYEKIKRYYLDNPQKIEPKLSRMEKFLSTVNCEFNDILLIGNQRHKEIVKEIFELSNI